MLARLYIRNFALIESLEMQLDPGLNILTGETGAGKSLLLGAIGLILGRRVDYSYIFNPDDKCVVEAEFRHIPPSTRAELANFEDFDFDFEGEQITLRREASASGKSRAFINDTPVSLQVIRQVTDMLVDLHGQHENQRLLDPDQQIQLLDQYAGSTDKAKEFGRKQLECATLAREIAKLEAEERDARQQQDFLQFQLNELKGLDLSESAEAQLEEELALLQNAEEIREALSFATASLYENEASVYNDVSAALARLQSAARLNAGIRAQASRLEEIRYGLEDIARELGHTADGIDLDPGTLAQLQTQHDTLNRLKLKYGVRTATELGTLRDEIAAKVGRFESLGDQVEHRKKALDAAWLALTALGQELEAQRRAAALPLKEAIDALLHEVGLEHAEFEAAVTRHVAADGPLLIDGERVRPGTAGYNGVEFRIRTNKGMPMGTLAQTASGGEVSRVMLAIKAALAARADLSVLIFDEIDTGISGETANKVGKVMQKLADHYQVIAITHLPQIAGKGSTHFRIYKRVENGKTLSNVGLLSAEQRVMEVARMLSGEDPSPSAIVNAKELLAAAREPAPNRN
jgi:DNA repair protein RecN (Recombination protein N)